MGDCIYRAATIGGFHTWRDFHAVIQNSEIVGSPAPEHKLRGSTGKQWLY